MFEVGFTEIVLILGIALLVLGPEKLPKLAGQIGRWVGRARSMARQLKAQLDEEVASTERPWTQPDLSTPPPRPGHAPDDDPPAAAAPQAGPLPGNDRDGPDQP